MPKFPTYLLLAFAATQASAVTINEIRIDQPSSDTDEYVEFLGSTNESLNGLTYLVVGDSSGGSSGVIESVTSLNGHALDNDGLFLLAKNSTIFGATVTPDLADSTLQFENSDNVTHLLVSGFSGSKDDDLDTDDDGTFDTTPWTQIIDSVALKETDPTVEGEQLYSDTQVGPDGSFVPAHVYRCPDEFKIGLFNPADVNALDSPGTPNLHCPTLINEIRIDQPSTDLDEYAEIIGTPYSALSGLTYIVIGDGSGGSGVIESVTNLNAESFDASGYFTFSRNATLFGGSVTANLQDASLNFENSDNVTHLLVEGFSGMLNDDLDTDNDGTLDSTPWTAIIDSVGLKETDPSIEGDQLYSNIQVGPDGSFVPGHVFRCPPGFQIGVFNPTGMNAKDTPTQENPCQGLGDGNTVTATIPEIQSNTDSSPLAGQTVLTSGIVTATFLGNDQLRGFFLQDPTGDSDATTSDGIFVFYPDGAVAIEVGDDVSITAQVTEFFELTELTSVTSLTVNSSGNAVPTPTPVSLPESTDGKLERYEGMLVEIISPMTVSQNFFLSRYGQLTLSSPDDSGIAGRLFQPTNQFPAGSPQAMALANENARRLLILDDGQDISGLGDNPDPVPYIGKDPVSVIRAGDSVSNLIGVLDYGRINSAPSPARDYRLHPTSPPLFNTQNPRPTAPANTNGVLSIASFNVLNYFTTIDTGASVCGPMANLGCRGADSSMEFTRQQDKLVSALIAIDADIVGLIEIENNGFGAGSAIQALVEAVNTQLGATTYAVLPVDEGVMPGLGGDAIAVGFIFKPDTVTPVGTVATLSSGAFADNLMDGGFSRQPIAASFKHINSGDVFTTVINHFKSKRPPSSPLGNDNDDQGDGQGSWNARRVEAANDLADWLATDPTGVADGDVLILGDLNAYAQEDPILALKSKGYEDLVKLFNGETSYSFTFDGMAGSLDHAMASSSLISKVSGVTQWHTNTDEPPVLDYNTEFNPTGYYQVDPFRASDHDAVIIGLDFGEACYVIPLPNKAVVNFCL